MVDALHTYAINAETLIQLIQTINFASEGRTCAIVRVPGSNSDLLTHALDAGAAGIIFPHIDTPEEAAVAVAKCRYAYSGGERSRSPFALIAGLTDMAPPGSSHERVADENIAVICQIESALSLKNLEAIAANPGISALMLGQTDLRISLGLPSKPSPQSDDRRFLAAVDNLINTAEKYDKALMAVAFKCPPNSDSWLFKFKLLVVSADLFSIVDGQRQDLVKIKTALEAFRGGKKRTE